MSAKPYHQQRDAVPAPARCPVNHQWDPLSSEYLADPYAVAGQLRRDSPVFYAESIGYVVVTRMEDIEAIFTDHDTFASVNVQDPVFPLCAEAQAVLAAPDFNPIAVMSNSSNPDHARIRRFTREGFSNRRLKSLEPFIRDRANQLVDDMIAAGPPLDFIPAFAFPLPGETIFRFIGFPEADDEQLKQWCVNRKAFSWGHPDPATQVEIAQAMVAYWRYCREFTAYMRDHRGADFTSELITAHETHPDELSYAEVESIVYGLSFAGHEAVTALLCNCLLCLLPRRDQWQRLCADPGLIPNAVEEVLRFESSQISWRRVTTRDTRIGDVDVPAGTPIFLNFASANREPEVFEAPDTFSIERKGARRHISFGKGIHFCLGARMAREESRIVLEVLCERLPTLRMVAGQTLSAFPNVTFRGPETLHLEW